MSDPYLAFTVPGNPVPKQRPRLGRGGGVYTPERTATYEQKVGWMARSALRHRGPTDAPVAVSLTFWTNGQGDIDNLAKSVLDGLNGVAWADDRQVKALHARIDWDGSEKRVEVEVREL